jgi:hypothetical protein
MTATTRRDFETAAHAAERALVCSRTGFIVQGAYEIDPELIDV